jgi:hypothetical protein
MGRDCASKRVLIALGEADRATHHDRQAFRPQTAEVRQKRYPPLPKKGSLSSGQHPMFLLCRNTVGLPVLRPCLS